MPSAGALPPSGPPEPPVDRAPRDVLAGPTGTAPDVAHRPVVGSGRRPGGRPTIKDVAALAGVSYSAASRALNGTGYVGARARARVMDVAAELGYVPHLTARYLKERVTPAVGLLVDDLRHPAQAAFAAGVLAAARERGLTTMLADRVVGPEPDRTGLLGFVAFGVAGVVVVPGPGGSTEHLARYGIPTVEAAPAALAEDPAAAGRDAVERLAGALTVGRAPRTG